MSLTLKQLQQRALADSKGWFPAVHFTQHDAMVHFALGIAGEVGELVNIIKKINRRSTTLADNRDELELEMADIQIYLCDLAETAGVDLERAVERKRAILIERWGLPGPAETQDQVLNRYGIEHERSPAPAPADKVVDLMTALEESVADAKAARKRHPQPAAKRTGEVEG